MRDEPDLFFLNDDAVPFPDTPAYHNSDGYERQTVRYPERPARRRAPRAPLPHSQGPSTQEPGNGDAAAAQLNRQQYGGLTDKQNGVDTVQRRRAVFSEGAGRSEAPEAGPPSIRQTNKRHLQKGQWQEVATRLRTGGGGRGVFRVHRYAIDDLRLLKALEEAGMEGRVVVADSVRGADVVLASALKRGSKKVDVSEAEAAARNEGIPFIRLPALSAIRVMEAIAPLMGIPIPPHLLNRSLASSPYLPPRDPELQDVLGLLDRCAQQQQQQQQQQQAGGAWTGAAAAGAAAVAANDRLGPPPNLDWLDVDYPGDPPKQKGDTVAHKYPLLRAIKPGSKIRKKQLQKYLAQQNAPW